jgi:hypothetical protein
MLARHPTTQLHTQGEREIRKKNTYSIRPCGPREVYPIANITRPAVHTAPKLAAKTGYWRPETSRAPRKGVRFSVKFAWARWAIFHHSQSNPLFTHTLNDQGRWLAVLGRGDGRTAVELVRLGVLLGLLGRGKRVGVGDAGLLAAGPGEEGVQGVDEEG